MPDEDLRPEPWWVGTGEVLANIGIMAGVGAPVMYLTENVYATALVSMAALILVQIVYWRAIRGLPLREVYDL